VKSARPRPGERQSVDDGDGALGVGGFDEKTGLDAIVAGPDLSKHAISAELPGPIHLIRKDALAVALLELFTATFA
jgi:hypothetical protein